MGNGEVLVSQRLGESRSPAISAAESSALSRRWRRAGSGFAPSPRTASRLPCSFEFFSSEATLSLSPALLGWLMFLMLLYGYRPRTVRVHTQQVDAVFGDLHGLGPVDRPYLVSNSAARSPCSTHPRRSPGTKPRRHASPRGSAARAPVPAPEPRGGRIRRFREGSSRGAILTKVLLLLVPGKIRFMLIGYTCLPKGLAGPLWRTCDRRQPEGRRCRGVRS